MCAHFWYVMCLTFCTEYKSHQQNTFTYFSSGCNRTRSCIAPVHILDYIWYILYRERIDLSVSRFPFLGIVFSTQNIFRMKYLSCTLLVALLQPSNVEWLCTMNASVNESRYIQSSTRTATSLSVRYHMVADKATELVFTGRTFDIRIASVTGESSMLTIERAYGICTCVC